VFLIEGSTVACESQDKSKWPKDFFQLLVKKGLEKWIEAVKEELWLGWAYFSMKVPSPWCQGVCFDLPMFFCA
jgi:hypothetical protein